MARARTPPTRPARWRRLGSRPPTATALPYEDASFDAAYSASVIEHIPGDGDTTAMAELARVLQPGRPAGADVPVSRREHDDEYVEHDLYGERYTGTPIFFQRHYSAASVQERLLAGGAFTVVERGIWRKAAVKEAQGKLRRVVPARFEIGRFLGPGADGPRRPRADRRARRRPRARQRACACCCAATDAGRAQPRLPRARRDRRHGGLRPRADPAAGGRAGLELVALVNREAAADATRRGRDVPMRVVPVHARNRRRVGARRAAARAAARGRGGLRPGPQPRLDRAAAQPRCARITTIHDLNYKLVPEAHFGLRALGHARARAGRGAALAPHHRRRRVDAARPRRAPRDAARRRSTSCRSASRRRRRSRRRARPSCASGSGSATARVLLTRVGQAPAQEPAAAARRGARCCETRPVLVLPGYPTPHEAELRERAAALGVRGGVPGLGVGRGPRGPLRAGRGVRVPVAGRGLRPAGAGGDGARRAGRVLRPLVAARGRRRRRAAVRPARSAGDRRRARGCSIPAEADAPARRRPRAGRALHLGALRGADRRGLRARAGA